MCGIFAILKNEKSDNRGDILGQMLRRGLESIRHRGPDGSNIWVSADSSVGFGHVRLAIVDLDTGSQPMSIEDGTTIIFNGEIYNYLELREELGPNLFVTTSDTEVILRAFKRWGADCVNHLRGMFAFLIWDAVTGKVFFARDRFGIKPLYWYEHPSGDVYFASEIKAFLEFLADRNICPNALSDYFSLQLCLGNKTLVQGVKQVQPAHFGWIENGGQPKTHQYWEAHYNLDLENTDSFFVNRIQMLANESAMFHMRADVEVGAYVSGGVDSSLLAILGSRYKVPSSPFKIFNGKFVEGDAFARSQYAQAVADEHDMELHVASISEQDFVDSIAKVIYHLDSPVAGPGAFPQYMVSKLAGQHLKVVLGGQGGDEIFGGYARYLIGYFEQCIQASIDGTLNDKDFTVGFEVDYSEPNRIEILQAIVKGILVKWSF